MYVFYALYSLLVFYVYLYITYPYSYIYIYIFYISYISYAYIYLFCKLIEFVYCYRREEVQEVLASKSTTSLQHMHEEANRWLDQTLSQLDLHDPGRRRRSDRCFDLLT